MADDTNAPQDAGRKTGGSPAPAQATSDAILSTLTLTTEQVNYLRDLREKETNFDFLRGHWRPTKGPRHKAMAWTPVATATADLDCRPPFSFYFDLVASYWRCDGYNLTFHRICTLCRKQRATFVCIETAIRDPAVIEEVDLLDNAHGGGGEAEAIAFAFIVHDGPTLDIKNVADDAVLAKAILINYRKKGNKNYDVSYIFEAMLQVSKFGIPNKDPTFLLNNFIAKDCNFDVIVKGRQFVLQGVYFCQQTGITHVCAHAALRMGLNTMNEKDPMLTSAQINKILSISPPFTGLSVREVSTVIQHAGYADNVFPAASTKRSDIATISAIVESGYVALVVFTTAHGSEHVVPVFGHTRNSDEWHPQALPEYAGPIATPFYSSSSWIDHFIIHDDNFGPYYSLSARALEVDKDVQTHWIIPICPIKLETSPTRAEAIAAFFTTRLLTYLKSTSISMSAWLKYMAENQWKYIYRTILIDKDTYLEHLRSVKGHDLSRITQAELTNLDGLPDEQFWMVEITLPGIFTGNRSKLGEFLIKATVATDDNRAAVANLLAVRFPGRLLTRNAAGRMTDNVVALDTHVPIYRIQDHDNQW